MSELTIPTNPEAEQAVLTTLLFENSLTDTARTCLKADDFFAPSHSLIYGAMLRCWDREGQFNPVLLADDLRKEGELEKAGNCSYLSSFWDGHVHFTHSDSLFPYIAKVKEAAIQRCILKLSAQMQTQATDREDVLTMLNRANRELEDLRKQVVLRQTDSIGDVVQTVLTQLEEIQANGGEAPGLRTGFPDLDKIIHGYRPGLLYLLAGASSDGKTTLLLQSILRVTRDKRNGQPVIGLLSLEMPKQMIVLRLLQLSSSVSDQDMHNGKMDKDDWHSVIDSATEISAIRIKVSDPERGVVEEVGAFIDELKRDFGRVDLLAIDFIQLLASDEPDYYRRNRANQVDLIAYGLKRAAKRHEVPIVALSQITREASKRTERDANDLRDSDGLKQASDVILMITCTDPEGKKNNADLVPYELACVKNRFGRVGKIDLSFSSVVGAFGERI